jgi:LysM repeat protein
MKLSHAFMIVLVLHIVAVGGLFAFNRVKSGHSKISSKLQNEVAAGQEALAAEVSQETSSKPTDALKREIAPVPAPSKPSVAALSATTTLAPPLRLQERPRPVEGKRVATAPVVSSPTATRSAFLATKMAASSSTAAPSSSSAAVSAVASIASIASPPATPALEPTAVASTAATEYTIVKGDNPYKIAKRFHVSYEQLVKFNNISDPRKMQIGEKIRIPKKS